MIGRTLRLPVLIAAAAVAACAIVLMATSHEAEAAFPGKNGKIAFSRYVVDKPPDIFVAAADGSGLRNLTNTRGVGEGNPAWSPDGKTLAYEKTWPDLDPESPRRNRDPEIAILDLESGRGETITRNSYNDLYPAWSPDGAKIAFSDNSRYEDGTQGFDDIYSMNRDGSGLRRLTKGTERDTYPAFSPDGSEVVFERRVPYDATRLWTVDADGGDPENLSGPTAVTTTDRQPDWSPDGAEIAFERTFVAEGGDYRTDIYAVKPDGSGLRNITGDPNVSEGAPAFSPNGRRIAFARFDRRTDQVDIWTVRAADGSDLRNVADTPNADEYSPAWRPIP